MVNLLWFGPATDPSGYGVATRGYLRQIVKSPDVNVRLVNRRFWGYEPYTPDDFELFLSMTHTPCIRTLPIVAVFHLTPDHYSILEGVHKHVGMTTFETDSVPLEWRLPMRGMDEIWTFTHFNERTFGGVNLERPIHVIPHGVDCEMFQSDRSLALPELRQAAADRFVFGSLFSWDKRKNPQMLIRAFLDAFSGPLASKVCLILKVISGDDQAGRMSKAKAEIGALKQDIQGRMGNVELPPIMILADVISDKRLVGFYNSIDCYVLPSSGEGWSLTCSEAMACGLPVISTGWGGNTEFMHTANSYLLSYKMAKVSQEMCSATTQIGHKWSVPDYNHLKKTMMYVFNNPKEASCVGAQARMDMASAWSWERAGEKLHDNLVRLATVRTKHCSCGMTVKENPKAMKLHFSFDSDCDRDRTNELRQTLVQRGHKVTAGKITSMPLPQDTDVWFCGIYGDDTKPCGQGISAGFKGKTVFFQCNDEAELMLSRLNGEQQAGAAVFAHNYLYHNRSVYPAEIRERLVLLPGFLPDHPLMHGQPEEHNKMKRIFFMGQATGKKGKPNQRIDMVRLLASAGLPFFGGITGQQHLRDQKWGDIKDIHRPEITPEQYLNEMRSSIICMCPAGNSPITYRLYEAWAVTSLAFVPASLLDLDILGRPEAGSEFVTFNDDLSDLVEKCCYYLTNPEDIINIAVSGHKRWKELYQIENGVLMPKMEALVVQQFQQHGINL
jgi:glycosyltransferase involved in cell wall biosynthesis